MRTRLELATPGVTGRYSNRLNYRTSPASLLEGTAKIVTFFNSTRVASDFFISLSHMKIIVADSSDLIRTGLIQLIRTASTLEAEELEFFEADSLERLLSLVERIPADMCFVESYMVEDDMTAHMIELVRNNNMTHWVIMAEKPAKLVLQFVKEHSNFSIFLKKSCREEIQSCIRMAVRHEQFICNECLRLIYENENEQNKSGIITPAECVVLALLAQGVKVKDIAILQNRSKHTIRTHKRDIFAKLGVSTTVEAIMTAYKLGLIKPPETR